MTVTLYAFPPLPNPQKALLALQEFGIPYEVKTVNVIAAENLTPDFLSLNPNGTVPVLVIDLAGGQRKIISESSDIVLNAAARGHVQQTCDAAFVKKWVSDLNLWNGPLYTLAHDAVLKRMISSVNAYKVQLAEARQTQYPALEDAYIKAASRYRNAGKALIALQPCQVDGIRFCPAAYCHPTVLLDMLQNSAHCTHEPAQPTLTSHCPESV